MQCVQAAGVQLPEGAADPVLCAVLCHAHAECAFFTLTRWGVCYLKRTGAGAARTALGDVATHATSGRCTKASLPSGGGGGGSEAGGGGTSATVADGQLAVLFAGNTRGVWPRDRQCSVLRDTDFPGHDLPDGYDVPSPAPRVCALFCEAHSRCAFFSHTKFGRCYLKGTTARAAAAPAVGEVVSGDCSAGVVPTDVPTTTATTATTVPPATTTALPTTSSTAAPSFTERFLPEDFARTAAPLAPVAPTGLPVAQPELCAEVGLQPRSLARRARPWHALCMRTCMPAAAEPPPLEGHACVRGVRPPRAVSGVPWHRAQVWSLRLRPCVLRPGLAGCAHPVPTMCRGVALGPLHATCHASSPQASTLRSASARATRTGWLCSGSAAAGAPAS